jgi:hypothetical protein
MRNQEITFLPGGVQDVTQLMLGPIDAGHFDATDEVAPETIAWFNRQATIWSAHALLEESCFILMAALENFVRMNEQQMGQAEGVLDRTLRAECALSEKEESDGQEGGGYSPTAARPAQPHTER